MIAFLAFITVSLIIGDSVAQNSPAAIIVHPPTYTTASEGQTVRLTCAAHGVPTPSITWSRAAGGVAGYKQYNEIVTVNGTDFRVSVLEICGAAVADTDEFMCTGDNGVSGVGVASNQARFFLSVTGSTSEPPSVVVRPPSDTTVDYGSTVEAVCVAYGYPIPTIMWKKDSCSDTSCSANAKIYNEVVTYGKVSFRKSILQLCNVDESNMGWYTCNAMNGLEGEGVAPSSFSWQLVVKPNPSTTTSMKTSAMTSSTGCPVASSLASSPPTENVGRFSGVASEQSYQAIIGIETAAIIVLLVVAIVAIIAAIGLSRKKPKTVSEVAIPPKDPRVYSVENPVHGEQESIYEGEPGPGEMTYADLAKKMEADEIKQT